MNNLSLDTWCPDQDYIQTLSQSLLMLYQTHWSHYSTLALKLILVSVGCNYFIYIKHNCVINASHYGIKHLNFNKEIRIFSPHTNKQQKL
jgi:hypothetical protein